MSGVPFGQFSSDVKKLDPIDFNTDDENNDVEYKNVDEEDITKYTDIIFGNDISFDDSKEIKSIAKINESKQIIDFGPDTDSEEEDDVNVPQMPIMRYSPQFINMINDPLLGKTEKSESIEETKSDIFLEKEKTNFIDYAPTRAFRIISINSKKDYGIFDITSAISFRKIILWILRNVDQFQRENVKDVDDSRIRFFLGDKKIHLVLDDTTTSLDFAEPEDIDKKLYFEILKNPDEKEKPKRLESKPRPATPPLKIKKNNRKDISVDIIRHVRTILFDDTNSESYEEAKQWIIKNGGNNFDIEKKIFKYLENLHGRHVENSRQLRKKVQQAHSLIENWIEYEKSLSRHAIRSSYEPKPNKKDDVFKTKYNRLTGEVVSMPTKNWKKKIHDAKRTIKSFEELNPELFEPEYYENTISRLDRFKLEEVGDEEQEVTRAIKKFGDLKKKITKEEKKDVTDKIFMLYSIFIIIDMPMSKKHLEEFWENIFTKLSKTTERIFDKSLHDTDIFEKTQEGLKLKDQFIKGLMQDEEFVAYFNDFKDFIRTFSAREDNDSSEEENEVEIEHQEKLASKFSEISKSFLKDFKNYPIPVQRSVTDLAKMMESNYRYESNDKTPKFKIRVENVEGEDIKILDYTNISKNKDWELNVEVKSSKIQIGFNGLFAIKEMYEGERIAPFDGELLTIEQLQERYDDYSKYTPFFSSFEIKRRKKTFQYFIDATPYDNFIGRNVVLCTNPNAEIVPIKNTAKWEEKEDFLIEVDVELRALRNISTGDEICIADWREKKTIKSVIEPTIKKDKLSDVQLSRYMLPFMWRVSDYTMEESQPSFLIVNYLKQVEKMMCNKLLQTPKVRDKVEELISYLSIKKISLEEFLANFSKDNSYRELRNSLTVLFRENYKIVPNSELVYDPRAESTKKFRNTIISYIFQITQLDLPSEKRIFDKINKHPRDVTPLENEEIVIFNKLNKQRVEVVWTYEVVVLGHTFTDPIFKENYERIRDLAVEALPPLDRSGDFTP